MISGCNRQQAADEEQQARNHATAATSSRQWSSAQSTESRIVRVSRVFGGKDRHSKVKTVKGLRDRRVRLSVPTAIQIYDLQDRLGLNQPSKVVDWLLNAARHEIDKLPPLQFPPPQDLIVGHLPSPPMPLVLHEEKFGHIAAAAALASERAKAGHRRDAGTDDGRGSHQFGRLIPGGFHRFMGLNSSLLPMINSAMAYNNYTGEAPNNNNAYVYDSGAGSPAAAQYSSFPSLLSLAPGPHQQLVLYSSEAADEQFQIDNLGSHSLPLSSARAFFHDQTGS